MGDFLDFRKRPSFLKKKEAKDFYVAVALAQEAHATKAKVFWFFFSKRDLLYKSSATRPSMIVHEAIIMIMRHTLRLTTTRSIAMRAARRCVAGPVMAVNQAVIVKIAAGGREGHIGKLRSVALNLIYA
jgi:hypothetical protein